MIDLLFRGRRLVFESPLSPEEATERLRRSVAARSWTIGWTDGPAHRFEGTFADGRFHMVRAVRGRNSFRPVLDGTLSPRPGGVHVDVRLRLHPATLIFCLLLLAIVAPLVALAAAEFLRTRQVSPPILVMAAFPVVFSVFTVVLGVEATRATMLLAALFDAPPSRVGGLRRPSASSRGPRA